MQKWFTKGKHDTTTCGKIYIPCQVMHIYGHNTVPQNQEADKLAKAVAPIVVHKVSQHCELPEGHQGGSGHVSRGVKRQVAVQVTESSSEDNVQFVRDRRKRQAARATRTA